MKKSLIAFGLILLCATLAAAQDYPKMETFLGYQFTRFNSATNAPSFNANGGSGQFVYNFNKWLGAVADLGAVHTGSISGVPLDNTMSNFLFGPRVSFKYSRLRPYVQVLWGGVYDTASTRIAAVLAATPSNPIFIPGLPNLPLIPGQPITARITASQTAFAMTAGGGLDIKISKHVMFRPIGIDYYLTRLQNLRTQGDNNQNNLRYTAGINFTFGAR
jgi:opacity protein-like surface antigen